MLRAREALTQRFGRTVPDAIIDEVLRNGDADIGRDYVDTIREAAAGYAAEIMRRLREHEYDPPTTPAGGGGGGGGGARPPPPPPPPPRAGWWGGGIRARAACA